MSRDADFSGGASAQAISDHVLVVDDNEKDAAGMRLALERAGHRVTIAKDGGQALASFHMKRPDFVILDLILPGQSGFEICESLKQQNKDTPILILSAIDMEDSRNLAARVGADGYVTKPITAQELTEEVARVADAVWRRIHVEGAKAGEPRVRFTCSCGKRFRVSPVHRGRALSCPGCGETVIVPHHD